jgi:hypothetical protein
MNNLYIPDLNPVKFVELNPVQVPQYLSRHLEDWRFQDLQYKWNSTARYAQKWMTSDTTYLQFESNFDPISIDICNADDYVVATVNALQKRANKYLPGYYVYEVAISWAAIPKGCYYMKMALPDRVLISEPILVSSKFENTVLLEYRNSRYHGDVIFETGIKFGLRVEATRGFVTPGTNNVVYEDQKLNPTVLSSRPFRSFRYNFGMAKGLPDWMIDKLSLAFTCNDVTIDGKSYAKDTDSKWAYKETERYQMRGATLDLREGINRGSKIISPGVDPNKRLIVAFNVQGTIFGDVSQNASSTIIKITDVE